MTSHSGHRNNSPLEQLLDEIRFQRKKELRSQVHSLQNINCYSVKVHQKYFLHFMLFKECQFAVQESTFKQLE